MATGGLLSVRLAQIRRRLRLLAAAEGSIAGAALGMLGVAVSVALVRSRGGAPGAGVVAGAILLCASGGAILRAARRIPLPRCARLADAALDGQDRLLSALYLDSQDPSPFARALVADAVRRAALLVPKAAVPARRPAGLPVLGIAALALVGAALFPPSSRAARVGPGGPRAGHRAPPAAGALDAEREAARVAAGAAAQLGDSRLAALAAEFDRTLRRLAAGTLNDSGALDLLRALEARAAEAARAAERDGQAAEAAARALQANAETRAAGQALEQAGRNAPDEQRASAALGASAAAHPAQTARALASAAASLAGPAGDTGDGTGAEEGRRRLSRDDSSAGTASSKTTGDPGDPQARHLEKLRRDLDEAAAACRAGASDCRPRAEERGRELAQLGRQGAARASLQQLQRSAEQLRARIRRGELGDADAQAMRSFRRAANGEGAAPGGTAGDETGNAEGDRQGALSDRQGPARDGEEAGEGPTGAETAAASAATGAEGGGASREEDQDGKGNGIGHQPGGAPLGARRNEADTPAASETNVPVAEGAGPGRAEVIGTAAGRGFASSGYARAFNDYAAAVEDALGATAVPEGKRYLVRRYFDLIRPRPPARAPGSTR